MGTKNLGRTAVEGGRTGYYKNRVAQHEASLRAETREFLKMAVDEELGDSIPLPVRRPKSKRGNQTDKLNGVYRFLDTLVGKSWKKVWALIVEKFNDRTLAGRHVLHCHIIDQIDPHPYVEKYGGLSHTKYYVDDYGIFKKREPRKFGHYESAYLDGPAFTALKEWLGGRGVMRVGERLFWCIPSVLMEFRSGAYRASYSYAPLESRFLYARVGWRQDLALTDSQVKYYKSLPRKVQEALLAHDIQD